MKDAFGMKLYVGNRVVVQIGGKLMTGIIESIDDGGVNRLGLDKIEVRQGQMVVNIQLQLNWDPRAEKLGDVFLTLGQPDIDPTKKPDSAGGKPS